MFRHLYRWTIVAGLTAASAVAIGSVAASVSLAQEAKPGAAGGGDDTAQSDAATPDLPPAAVAFFEKKIRPVLASECYECHRADLGRKVRGGLVLDTRDGTRAGGDSGPVIVPGDPARSLLIQALKHGDDLAMPPKKKLDAEVIRDFEEWVKMGAPDPRKDGKVVRKGIDLEEGKKHWSFQPPRKATPPEVKNEAWPRTDADRFLLAALEAKGLSPVADADARTLLRRLTFDLIGLPPEPAEVEAFVADVAARSPAAALESAAERLLSSRQFGEKWARHWLDVARFAETTGKTVNFNYPHAWRYRDYVIGAFNSDKPYDQFIKEQIAGDLMKSDEPAVQAERLVATGFLAIGPKTLNERNGLRFELDVADEQIDVTTQAFLGITAACARCHDHKFDPIPQRDYYALAGIFRSTETCYGTVQFINAQRPSRLVPLPAEAQPAVALQKQNEFEKKRVEEQIKTLRESMQEMKDQQQRLFANGQLSLLQARLDAYDADGNPKLLAMGVRDKPAGVEFPRMRNRLGGPGGFTFNVTRNIGDSPVYARGEPDQPGDSRVPRGILQVLAESPLAIPSNTSGRLQLAEWIASKQNPLTARVMVNRVWLQLFGQGLVPTVDDFGFAGRPPSNPQLLDHLAHRFMDDGWSVKRLIKYLVTSRAYQLSAKSNPSALESDPDNTLVWRMSPRRLDAEAVRDALLAVSGQLDPKAPVGSAVARAGEGPTNRPRFAGESVAQAINDPRDAHRSIYLPIVRDSLPESLALFDAADPTLITADRKQTTVPSQGLYLLNNAFVLRAADAAAEKLVKIGSDSERIQTAFARFFSRPASADELSAAEAFLAAYRERLKQDRVPESRREQELWSAYCQALFATAEFQYRR